MSSRAEEMSILKNALKECRRAFKLLDVIVVFFHALGFVSGLTLSSARTTAFTGLWCPHPDMCAAFDAAS